MNIVFEIREFIAFKFKITIIKVLFGRDEMNRSEKQRSYMHIRIPKNYKQHYNRK